VTFADLGLKESTLKAITDMGFTSPSEIQEQAIPILIKDDIDFIGQAQTGTGKTAAFGLPLLQKIDVKSRKLQALIIAPTRELANQICEEFVKLSKYEPVSVLAVYGGTSVSGQIRDLKAKRPQIIVGTPGRLMDFMDRGLFNFEACNHVILDEADEMLDMGFFDDVQEILAMVPQKKIWMFSATMPGPIMNLVREHFNNPVTVKVTKKILTADAIDQQFIVVRRDNRIEALCRYLDFIDNVYAIIFMKTKIGAKELTDELNARGYPTDALHGDMGQDSRDLTMKKFKEKKINLLVCTDVAARGIDVSDLTHVINFSLPQDNESYVHRIGRTGRGGSKGVALSIIETNEQGRIAQIERLTKAKIERIALPKVADIKDRLLTKSLTEFSAKIAAVPENSPEIAALTEKFKDLDRNALIKGIYSYIFESAITRYQKAIDIDAAAPRERSTVQAAGPDSRGMQRFFINIGQMDGAGPGELIKFISTALNIRGSEIGKIDSKEKFAFIEIHSAHTDSFMSLKGEMWNNRRLSIELANPRMDGPSTSRGGGYSRGSGGSSSRSGGSSYRGGDRGGDRGGRSFSNERSGSRAGSFSSRDKQSGPVRYRD
jgi:ATP-dependent RNA helicase DeaD